MRAVLAAILVLISVATVHAGDGPHDRETLRGLTTIVPDVQADPTAALAGVIAPDLQKDIALRLHLAGIRGLASPDEDIPPKERGVLTVSIAMVPVSADSKAYAYSVVVSLLQGLVMIRDMETVVAAPTWWIAKTGVGEAPQVKAAVNEATEKFVAAFLSVNKRK